MVRPLETARNRADCKMRGVGVRKINIVLPSKPIQKLRHGVDLVVVRAIWKSNEFVHKHTVERTAFRNSNFATNDFVDVPSQTHDF